MSWAHCWPWRASWLWPATHPSAMKRAAGSLAPLCLSWLLRPLNGWATGLCARYSGHGNEMAVWRAERFASIAFWTSNCRLDVVRVGGHCRHYAAACTGRDCEFCRPVAAALVGLIAGIPTRPPPRWLHRHLPDMQVICNAPVKRNNVPAASAAPVSGRSACGCIAPASGCARNARSTHSARHREQTRSRPRNRRVARGATAACR